jgi:hypothetical protein
LLLATSAAIAENLLHNPGFDTSVAGWNVDVGSSDVVWDSFDHNGKADSGSALVTGLPDDSGPYPSYRPAVMKQCVSVLPGHSYVFGASVWLADFQGTNFAWYLSVYSVGVSVLWTQASNCMGPGVAEFFPVRPAVGSTWIDIQANRAAPAGAASAFLSIEATLLVRGLRPRIYVDDTYFLTEATCVPTASHLCLAAGRFRASGSWSVPDDRRSVGYMRAVPLGSESGLFWFFSAQNPEIIIKVLNACGNPSQHYWVFAAGLTNVETSLSVEDTITGEIRNYVNPFGTAFAPVQDTSAFATCP